MARLQRLPRQSTPHQLPCQPVRPSKPSQSLRVTPEAVSPALATPSPHPPPSLPFPLPQALTALPNRSRYPTQLLGRSSTTPPMAPHRLPHPRCTNPL